MTYEIYIFSSVFMPQWDALEYQNMCHSISNTYALLCAVHTTMKFNDLITCYLEFESILSLSFILFSLLQCKKKPNSNQTNTANTYVYIMRAHFWQWLNQTNTNKWICIIVWYSPFYQSIKFHHFIFWLDIHYRCWNESIFASTSRRCSFSSFTQKFMPNSLARTCIAVFKFIAFHFYMFSFLSSFFFPFWLFLYRNHIKNTRTYCTHTLSNSNNIQKYIEEKFSRWRKSRRNSAINTHSNQ